MALRKMLSSPPRAPPAPLSPPPPPASMLGLPTPPQTPSLSGSLHLPTFHAASRPSLGRGPKPLRQGHSLRTERPPPSSDTGVEQSKWPDRGLQPEGRLPRPPGVEDKVVTRSQPHSRTRWGGSSEAHEGGSSMSQWTDQNRDSKVALSHRRLGERGPSGTPALGRRRGQHPQGRPCLGTPHCSR